MKPFQKVAVHGFIKNGNRYLLTKRSITDDYKPGLWDLVGGTIEIGETPEEALTRELAEEIDIKVKIIKPLFVCSDFQNNLRHQFWMVYECDYISGEVKLNEEHDKYIWSTIDEIDKLPKIFFLENFYIKNLRK